METTQKTKNAFELFEEKKLKANAKTVKFVLDLLNVNYSIKTINANGKTQNVVEFSVQSRLCVCLESSSKWIFKGQNIALAQDCTDLVIALKAWTHTSNLLRAIDYLVSEKTFLNSYKDFILPQEENTLVEKSAYQTGADILEQAKQVPIQEVLARLNIFCSQKGRFKLRDEKQASVTTRKNYFIDFGGGEEHDRGSVLDLVINVLDLQGDDKLFRAADFILNLDGANWNEEFKSKFGEYIKTANQIPTPAERAAQKNSEPNQAEKTVFEILSVGKVVKRTNYCYRDARKIHPQVFKEYFKEFSYTCHGILSNGVGMINRSGGLESSYAITRPVEGEKGVYTYEKSYKTLVGKPDITLIKRAGQSHQKYLIVEGQFNFAAYESLCILKNKPRYFHVIILNRWANYTKALDFLPSTARIFYAGDNDLANPNKPNEIPRGDFVLTQFKKVYGDAVQDLRPNYAHYKDLNDVLMQKQLPTPKTY